MNPLLIASTIALTSSYFWPSRNREITQRTEREEIIYFMTSTADACMIDILAGQLASDIATTEQLRTYGRKVAKEQQQLLDRLKVLANEKQVILPDHLTEENKKILHRLTGKTGEAFDAAFLQIIRKNRMHDVKQFERAVSFSIAEFSGFAKEFLPEKRKQLNEVKNTRHNR